MKILYGTSEYSIDVTEICLEKLTKNNVIRIPAGDENRAKYFTDPLFKILKKVFIVTDESATEYDHFAQIKINTTTNEITTINTRDVYEKLKSIQSKLEIRYGNFNEELPEQKMAVTYLSGNEKVLEIGGNIGRNSLVIASILQDPANLVVLESDINIAKKLTENRDANHFTFHIESAALSNRKLIQQNWITKPSDVLEEGHKWVDTITLDDLKKKYNIAFDTLILDCEGAFYYILMDMPEILDGVNLIIMENDYFDISEKNYINDILTKNNFVVDYSEEGGWGPCYANFFEVWKK